MTRTDTSISRESIITSQSLHREAAIQLKNSVKHHRQVVLLHDAGASREAEIHASLAYNPCAQPESRGEGTFVAGTEARAAVGAVKERSSDAVAGGPPVPDVAQAADPRSERVCWSTNFSARDYVEQGLSFNYYGPVYDFGANARGRYAGLDFDDVKPEVACDWAANRGASSLSWERARHAARDSWNLITPSNLMLCMKQLFTGSAQALAPVLDSQRPCH